MDTSATRITPTLAGVAELSDLLSVRRTTISQWHSRQNQNSFPDPIADLAMGPVWDQDEVVQWYRNYRPLRNMRKVGSLPDEFQGVESGTVYADGDTAPADTLSVGDRVPIVSVTGG